MGFPRHEYWNGLPCTSPGDLPDSGIKAASLMSQSVAGRFFTISTPWEAQGNPVGSGESEIKSLSCFPSSMKNKQNQIFCQGCRKSIPSGHQIFKSHDVKISLIIQVSSVTQLCLTLYNPWTAARQASLSSTNLQSLLKIMFTELVMPSNHLILWSPLLLLPSNFPSIRVFSNESVLLCLRWSKNWSFSFQWLFRTDFL